MRTRIILLFGVFVLLVGALSIAQPVAAAPAEPFRFSEECTVTMVGGDTFELCTSGHGVFQQVTLPSGDIKVADNGTFSTSFFVNGEFLESSKTQFNITGHIDIETDEFQVFHHVSKQSFTFINDAGEVVTCIAKTNFTFANGQIRHEVFGSWFQAVGLTSQLRSM